MTELVRLNVNLNAETAKALRDLADAKGASFTEIVRRCISVYSFLDKEQQNGSALQVLEADRKTVRSIVLL